MTATQSYKPRQFNLSGLNGFLRVMAVHRRLSLNIPRIKLFSGSMYKASWRVGLTMLLGLLVAVSASGRPSQVILLRHAEKPDDESNTHLSERGKERAQALVSFITNNAALTNHGSPPVLFATRAMRLSHSRRPIETLEPLAQQLKVPVQTMFPASEYRALARYVLASPDCDGKTVVICWVHDYLPELAQALGVRKSSLKWKSTVFDRVWTITWEGDKAALKDLPQRLLPGDKKR